ncbi:aminoglycoside phosphotransferase family protein [Nocardia sp. NPDC050406]|uniref:aminoglycoside phosphotransferase family protein n=1 Tax=Nocardia sp. NPDC050406 TaxID=3364318 RepID=UPI0037A3C7F7
MDARYREILRRFGDERSEVEERSGQFHDILLTPTRAYRIPRTPSAVAQLRETAQALDNLSSLGLVVRMPVVKALLEDSAPACMVTSRIPGHSLPTDALTSATALDSVATQLLALLNDLQSAPVLTRAREILPTTSADRWQSFAHDVQVHLYPLMSAAGEQRATAELSAATTLPVITTALVHGDLGGENLLWESGPLLSGVVDWDSAAIGDPAEDLAALMAGYGVVLGERIVQLAGWPEALLARAHIIRGTFALQQALAGVFDGDADEVADGLSEYGYRRSNEVLEKIKD